MGHGCHLAGGLVILCGVLEIWPIKAEGEHVLPSKTEHA